MISVYCKSRTRVLTSGGELERDTMVAFFVLVIFNFSFLRFIQCGQLTRILPVPMFVIKFLDKPENHSRASESDVNYVALFKVFGQLISQLSHLIR